MKGKPDAPAGEATLAPYTTLGWVVRDIASVIEALVGRGVTFERFAGLPQDRLGIWRTPDGAQVAWFRDPDGNLLSITEDASPGRE
jgi:catechol 2,3-dioxygenase-like lactoylglutathione lyase family enzyme